MARVCQAQAGEAQCQGAEADRLDPCFVAGAHDGGHHGEDDDEVAGNHSDDRSKLRDDSRMEPRAIVMALAFLAGAAPLVIVAAQEHGKTQVLALAKPMSVPEAAARLTGRWKLNEELSPPLRASSSPLAGDAQGGPQAGGRRTGSGGRPQAREAQRLQDERNIRVRALYRELSIAPETLALAFSAATAKFVDPDGFERTVNINSKKEKLDLGTAVVASRSRWDGTALTIELDGGADLKVVETFELSPTGTQMLVTIRAGDAHDANQRGLRGQVQRVYDRVNAGRPSDR